MAWCPSEQWACTEQWHEGHSRGVCSDARIAKRRGEPKKRVSDTARRSRGHHRSGPRAAETGADASDAAMDATTDAADAGPTACLSPVAPEQPETRGCGCRITGRR